MSTDPDRGSTSIHIRILLSAVTGAAAGASRAIASWFLDHIDKTS
jgi:hypothetical protein